MEGSQKQTRQTSNGTDGAVETQPTNSIPLHHDPIYVADTEYDLGHLDALATIIPGKGIHPGTNLGVLVVFSNHVFTDRAQHGEPHHTIDHNGAKRTFANDRFEMSKSLAAAIKIKIETNELTYVSKSFGGVDNLVLVEAADGRTWTVVYCLKPTTTDNAVRMEVLSCHPKIVDQRKISRQHLSYFARKCLFEGCRTPKE